jgi:hypothetical protein
MPATAAGGAGGPWSGACAGAASGAAWGPPAWGCNIARTPTGDGRWKKRAAPAGGAGAANSGATDGP